jgi:DNA primase
MTSQDPQGAGAGAPLSRLPARERGGSFPSGFVDDVRRATSIVAVVEQHIALKRVGRALKGLCPFHSERTPSFHVDEAKGFYHCFGCGAGGDVFRFVMQVEGLSFPESVRQLAQRAGLAVPAREVDAAAEELRAVILDANHAAQEVFVEQLRGGGRGPGARAALSYLADRGIPEPVVEGFGLGWAPDSWNFLIDRLAGRFTAEQLVAAGLAVASERGHGAYDRFRGRITFPIRALSDRVVAFGGRVLGDGEPKYLNSPETPVYVKGRHLFGLDRARAGIRQRGHVVLVEGYLDAISLHAAGIDCAVAVLGTALTPDQARLLARFTRAVVLSFDGDAAGLQATKRSVETLLAERLDVRVLELPAGVDPDELVREVGPEGYLRRVEAAGSFFGFLLGRAASENDVRTPAGRVAALNALLPYLASVQDRVLRSELADEAIRGLGLPADLVREEVRRALRQGRRQVTLADAGAALPPLPRAARTLLTWALQDEATRELLRGLADEAALDELAGGRLLRAVLAEPPGELRVDRVLERLDDDGQRAVVTSHALGAEAEPVEATDLERTLRSHLEELGLSPRHVARRRKAEVDRLLEAALRDRDDALAHRLQAEAAELGRALQQAD